MVGPVERFVILSDVHANSCALAAVFARIKELEVDKGCKFQILVNGDFLDAGPYPLQTAQMLLEKSTVFIWGNHDCTKHDCAKIWRQELERLDLGSGVYHSIYNCTANLGSACCSPHLAFHCQPRRAAQKYSKIQSAFCFDQFRAADWIRSNGFAACAHSFIPTRYFRFSTADFWKRPLPSFNSVSKRGNTVDAA